MAKTRKILHFVDQGKEFSVVKVYNDPHYNPYKIYEHYRTFDANGYPKDHRKLRESYGNLASCWYWFIEHNVGF